MAHYAKVLDGKVISVIVADAEYMASFVDTSPGKWLQTSYNTRHNKQHKFTRDGSLKESDTEDGGTPLRGNYAGIGMTYDEDNDIFISKKPYDSWTLNVAEARWVSPAGDAPALSAEEQATHHYEWNESTKSWDKKTRA